MMSRSWMLMLASLLAASGTGEVPVLYADEYSRIVYQCDEEGNAARRRGDYSFDRDKCAVCRERERTNGFYDGVSPDSPCARFVSPSLLRRDSASSNSSSGNRFSTERGDDNDPRSAGGPERFLRDSTCLSMEVGNSAMAEVPINFTNNCGTSVSVDNVCAKAGMAPISGSDSMMVYPGRDQKYCRRR